jgi:hypothetical protein
LSANNPISASPDVTRAWTRGGSADERPAAAWNAGPKSADEMGLALEDLMTSFALPASPLPSAIGEGSASAGSGGSDGGRPEPTSPQYAPQSPDAPEAQETGASVSEAPVGQASRLPWPRASETLAQRLQADRASITSALGNGRITLDAHGLKLQNLRAVTAPTPVVQSVHVPYGLVSFQIADVKPGGIATIDMGLPIGATPDGYYKQNPQTGVLERFDFDGRTGAIVNGKTITLHLQDGGRGDDDGIVNGIIVDPGGPGTGGSGSMSGTTTIEADTEWIYRDDVVSFWAYSTADPPPTFTQIEWDFNYDGTTFVPDASASGELVEHTFTANGTYMVAAQFTLSGGGTDLAWMTVDVHHLPPVLTGPEDVETTAGAPVTLTVSETHEADIASVEWWISQDGQDYEHDSGATGLTSQYEFREFGTYDFWVSATDVDGEVGETQFRVSVSAATPVGGVTVSTDANNPIDEANNVTFTVNELNWDDALDDISIYADWTGSGEFDLVDSEEWIGNLWNEGVASFTHFYDDGKPSGVYSAKVRIENEAGANSEYPVDVHVRDVAPIATLTAGSPGAGSVGRKVTNVAYSKQEVWAISESTSIGFFDAGDASAADLASQEYHFIVRKYDVEGRVLVETTEHLQQKDPWIQLPEYKAGRSYEVEAWLTDKDSVEFSHQAINVVMEGNVDGEPYGMFAPQTRFYGTMKVQGQELPASYNRYGLRPEIKRIGELGPTEQLTVELVLDHWSQKKVEAGTPVEYMFRVDEEHRTSSGPEYETNFYWQPHGTFTVPFFYPNDYRITVRAWRFSLLAAVASRLVPGC